MNKGIKTVLDNANEIRAIYKECDEIIEFRRLGSHSELYE